MISILSRHLADGCDGEGPLQFLRHTTTLGLLLLLFRFKLCWFSTNVVIYIAKQKLHALGRLVYTAVRFLVFFAIIIAIRYPWYIGILLPGYR